MAAKTRNALLAGLALAIPLALAIGNPQAAIQYLGDGAKQNAAGGWDLPLQGTCPIDPNQVTRPDCLALRFPSFTTQSTCTAGGQRSWSTGVCNDTVNTDQASCEAQPDRKWNNGVCAIVMKGDDRNKAVCTIGHGGTWVTSGTCVGSWVMPARDDPAYVPALFTGNGPGDQCLRCHNSVTEYNGPRIRDVDWYLRHGHKNMSRPVIAGSGLPWGGPGYECSDPTYTNRADCEAHGGTWDRSIVIYPSDDSGNLFDWLTGQVNLAGTPRDMTWIYGDWLAPLPRVIAKVPASSTQVCSDPRYTAANCVANGGILINNAGASYSCGRCHTTGWTSDATINASKEPERTFPGITWDRNSNAGFGVVNLSGAVSGDANKYSSWDVWGITCTRCHQSAVDNTSGTCSGSGLPSGLVTAALCTAAGGTWAAGPPFQAPLGKSSHHNIMTSSDGSNGGYCSDVTLGGTTKLQCEFLGPNTFYAQCSDPLWSTAALCLGAAGCVNPGTGHGLTYTTQATCEAATAGECSVPFYFTQTLCTTAGGTWTPAAAGWWVAKTPGLWSGSFCSIPGGTCSAPQHTTSGACTGAGGTWGGSPAACTFPQYTDYDACKAGYGTWASTWNDQIQCQDAGGRWTGFKARRGQLITSLCMDCHRQETGGLPYDTTNPAGVLKVGPAHGTVSFVSHPHGNQYLNSPHAKFGGTFSQIGTGTFSYAMTGEYKSFFMVDGEAANTGNGCTGCHDVHKSVVEEAFEPAPHQEGAIKEECIACHNKDLNRVMHPAGGGTPLEEMATEPFEACVSCHMPEGTHLWRINVDPNYSTWSPSALTTTVNANTAPHGTYANAVWVDLDHACGQCHGGGTNQAFTTGGITSGSKVLTVADTTGFAAGQRIQVADAGALHYDDMGLGRGDFETYIVSVVAPSTINLAGAPSLTVSGKSVIQNPVRNGGAYITKAQLAVYAKGMHNDKPTATFGSSLGSPNTLTVNVDASASQCSGDIANCDAFEWDWGDGSPAGSGVTASHTYAAPDAYDITLTVEQYSVGAGTVTRTVNVYQPDFPPTVAGVCTFDANTWTMTVTDSSTDDNAVKQVTVNWGDGSVIGNDTSVPFGPFTHTYFNVGSYTVTHKAIDTIGQQATRTCPAVPAYFTISGVVSDGSSNPVGSALVTVKKGTMTVKTVYSAANGSFSAGSLKPGTYSLYITKTGYTFASPAMTATVGPSSTGNMITGTALNPKEGGKKSHSPMLRDNTP